MGLTDADHDRVVNEIVRWLLELVTSSTHGADCCERVGERGW